MYLKPDYDVLRLFQYNGMCYVSSDNVEGCPLGKWLEFHPYMSKTEIAEWICDMVRQLSQIHKCRGNPEYQYVNPYSIIVTRERKLCFLDVCSDSNREYIGMMQRQSIKRYFHPSREEYEQMSSEERDIFGLGKTIQYLLAFTQSDPGFSRREERWLKKMIIKCIDFQEKRKFHTVEDIQKYLANFPLKREDAG